jgi:hypothetical protein
MLTVMIVLAIIAIVATVVAASGHCPLWAPVFILCVIELLRVLPLGKP